MTRFSDHDLDFPLDMPIDPGPSPHERYADLLRDTKEIYFQAGTKITTEHPELVSNPGSFVGLMDDLHRGLVLKTYCLVSEADDEWSNGERRLAEYLASHLWRVDLDGVELQMAMRKASTGAERLEWATLLRPFRKLPPLFELVASLETAINRQANLIARIDGQLKQTEQAAIEEVVNQLRINFGNRESTLKDSFDDKTISAAYEQLELDDSEGSKTTPAANNQSPKPSSPVSQAEEAETIDDVLAELDRLIGLDNVKEEVRTLINFLAMQKRREEAGLPKTDIGLHLVFVGNPGTGKTTVARLIGRAYRAMGILNKGHMVETDRSGLVAEYAGQTAVKANKIIDEALDGVLFIDEAYGLVASNTEDPYGNEAMQTLLKRAEDDRHRLAVILAGYPDEMKELLQSNPGLESRFSKTLDFTDYSPVELCHIFGCLLESNHYRITPEGRLRVIATLTDQFQSKEKGYGNGREVRNLFEKTILKMANRLAEMTTITDQELITFVADDFSLPESTNNLDLEQTKIKISCSACGHSNDAPAKLLGASVTCPKCSERFQIDWCDLIT